MTRWDAADYHQHSTAQQAWARELITKLDLAGDEYVLDVGSGDGKVTAELAEQLPRGVIVGVDASAEMVAFARETFPPERYPRLTFERMDARELTFEDEFDVVFSNATLHWVVDHRPVLAGIARALLPGGRTLLQMAGAGNARDVVAVMDAVCVEPEWRGCFEGFTFPYGFHAPVVYRTWLVEAGLTPRRVELFPKDMIQAGPAGLAGWIRTTWLPYLERVPEARRSDLIEAVVSRYVTQHPPAADGLVHVAMTRLEVEATRPA